MNGYTEIRLKRHKIPPSWRYWRVRLYFGSTTGVESLTSSALHMLVKKDPTKCSKLNVIKGKVKVIPYRPGVTQKVGRGIALLFHDRGTRRGWMVSSTPRPHFTSGKDAVPILQEAGWTPGPVWTDGKSRPHRDSIPDRPARSQSIYRLSYPAHYWML